MIRIAHVSTFPPLHCGIASFAADLIGSIPSAIHRKYVLHYGAHSTGDASGEANVSVPSQVADMARAISSSDCDVVSLQHEFGIWGGLDGEHLEVFLENLRKPVLSVLHTTFGNTAGNARRRDLVRTLVDQSSRVVVLTESARTTVETLLAKRIGKLVAIPHGIHEVNYVPPTDWSALSSTQKRFRLITPGYLREDKGLETMLVALWLLEQRGIAVSYLIAGEPQQQFSRQQSHLATLKALVERLGLTSIVTFDARYLSLSEQIKAIRDSHAGVFPYQDPSQSSSGTVPLVLATGRNAVCTPFEFAKAKMAEGQSVWLASSFGASALADAIFDLMASPNYSAASQAAHQMGEAWSWHRMGAAFFAQYADLVGAELPPSS